MLYIKKSETPKSVQEQVIKIQKSQAWKDIGEDDKKSIRSTFDTLNKDIIRKTLISEQHGLCAYCMRRIENNDNMVIEHYKHINKDNALDYQNMLGCCDGGRNKVEDNKGCLCCDASKGNQEITISPWDKNLVDRIRYTKYGMIKVVPDDKEINRQINEILKLNGKLDSNGNYISDTSTGLVAGRKAAYNSYEKLMKSFDSVKNKKGIEAQIRKVIDKIENSDIYDEYTGVILYFMKRRLKNVRPSG